MTNPLSRLAAILLIGSLLAGKLPAAEPERQQALAEQKLRLIESLLASPAIKAAASGGQSEAGALVAASRRLLEQARTSLQASRSDDAIRDLDQALKDLSKAGSLISGDPQAGSAASTRQFRERAAAVDSYRRTIEEMASAPATAAEARRLLARVEQLAGEAQRRFDAGKHTEGLQGINEAYRLAVGEISRLRQGQEVILRLHFDSPREEFDYEQKRYHSNEILIAMLSREERASGETKAQVDGLLRRAAEWKEAAAAKAAANDYAGAVKDMENAGQQLNRALQLLGVPVF